MTSSPKPTAGSNPDARAISSKFDGTPLKFRAYTEYADWPQDKAKEMIALVWTLEAAADVSALSPFLSANA